MLLWDCDDRYYSYYIEVSVNMWDWELIIDKSKELVRSWQLLQFNSRPIVFIRITGTYNSANEVSIITCNYDNIIIFLSWNMVVLSGILRL